MRKKKKKRESEEKRWKKCELPCNFLLEGEQEKNTLAFLGFCHEYFSHSRKSLSDILTTDYGPYRSADSTDVLYRRTNFTNFNPKTTYYKLQTTDYRLQTTDYRLQNIDYRLATTEKDERERLHIKD